MKSVIYLAAIATGFGAALWFVPPSSSALNRYNAMETSQLISASDCAIMAEVLKTQAGQAEDEFLIRNSNDDFNCPFNKLGIARTAWIETPQGFASKENSYHLPIEERQNGLAAFRKTVGSYYAEKPRYSLLRTRLKIEYGRANSGGSTCTYNRFTGKWKLESPCKTAWIA